MKTNALLKWLVIAVTTMISGLAGISYAATAGVVSGEPKVAIYTFPAQPAETTGQATDTPLDCKKNPEDPRCDKKK
jgi:hypothetical protein